MVAESARLAPRVVALASFIIWSAYGFLTAVGGWPAAVALGLIGTLVMMVLEVRSGLSVKLMDWTMLVYFTVATFAAFVFRSVTFLGQSLLIIWFMYAAVAWISILLRQPFSLQYARETTPAKFWNQPAFFRANQIISVVWAAAFLANLALVAAGSHWRNHALWFAIALPTLTMIGASLFTVCYTKVLRARQQLA